MLVTLKKEALYLNFNRLEHLGELKGSFKLAYAIVKCKDVLKKEISLLDEARKPAEDFQKYLEERKEITLKYCDRLEDGTPKVSYNAQGEELVSFGENHEKVVGALDKLHEVHKSAISKHEEKTKGFNDELGEEISLELPSIELDWLPEQISVKEMEALYFLTLVKEDIPNA